jgi:DNA-binding NarL/FixJ family response regulator
MAQETGCGVCLKCKSRWPTGAGGSTSPEFTLHPSREQELPQLLTKGYSYKMIADELQIALKTVHSHIKDIYRKLQVNSATEAICKVSKEKLV